MDDRQRVERNEGALTFGRIAELDRTPVEGKFDAAHLKEIHRRIFQDLPHHAPGEYRPDAPGGWVKGRSLEASRSRYPVHYAPRSQVDAGVEKVLAEFGGPDRLRGLNAEQFSSHMAKLYGDLDHLHPFKEGNSRTLRAFTAQIAREAGVEFSWRTTDVDAASRDRLYIARDKEVMQRAFPGVDQDRALRTSNPAETRAYVMFVAPFRKSDGLEKLIKEAAYRAEDLDAAKSFREESQEDAQKKNPALAGSFAKLAAIERKAEADGITVQQRSAVVAHAREILAINIERGERPAQTIKEVQESEKGVDRGAPER